MTGTCFSLEIADGVAHLRMKRPDAFNSLIPAFWTELPGLVQQIDAGAAARAIVLSGEGKHFCAGMDLSVFESDEDLPFKMSAKRGEMGRQREAFYAWMLNLQDALTCLETTRLPVIAAVQGACVGGGLDLACVCDIRYGAQSAFFCIQEINLGMVADLGTFPRLGQLLPQGLLRELAFTGRRLTADAAREAGFVTAVFPTHEETVAAALATAREIAEKSPLAVYGSKHVINFGRDHTIEDGLKHVALWQTAMLFGDDLQEAMRARTEKRTPTFPDLAKKP